MRVFCFRHHAMALDETKENSGNLDAGNGIFATVAFNRGDFLLVYVEERIDRLEAERRAKKNIAGNNEIINTTDVMSLALNIIRRNITRSIDSGEESRYDYGDGKNLYWRNKFLNLQRCTSTVPVAVSTERHINTKSKTLRRPWTSQERNAVLKHLSCFDQDA